MVDEFSIHMAHSHIHIHNIYIYNCWQNSMLKMLLICIDFSFNFSSSDRDDFNNIGVIRSWKYEIMLLENYELTKLQALHGVFVSIFILSQLIRWTPHFNRAICRTRVEFSLVPSTGWEQLIHCILMPFQLIHTYTFIEIPQFNEAIAPCSCDINAFDTHCCHTRYTFLVCLIIVALKFEFSRMLLVPDSKSFPTSTNQWFCCNRFPWHTAESSHRFILSECLRTEQFIQIPDLHRLVHRAYIWKDKNKE